MTLLFNVCDTIGRFLGGKVMAPVRVIISGSIARTIFAVSTILIAFKVSPDWLFSSDAFKIINMLLFAITNGYVST